MGVRRPGRSCRREAVSLRPGRGGDDSDDRSRIEGSREPNWTLDVRHSHNHLSPQAAACQPLVLSCRHGQCFGTLLGGGRHDSPKSQREKSSRPSGAAAAGMELEHCHGRGCRGLPCQLMGASRRRRLCKEARCGGGLGRGQAGLTGWVLQVESGDHSAWERQPWAPWPWEPWEINRDAICHAGGSRRPGCHSRRA